MKHLVIGEMEYVHFMAGGEDRYTEKLGVELYIVGKNKAESSEIYRKFISEKGASIIEDLRDRGYTYADIRSAELVSFDREEVTPSVKAFIKYHTDEVVSMIFRDHFKKWCLE